MTQIANSLYENEIENFLNKLTEPEFKETKLESLFLNTTSGSDLINSMRKLLLEKHSFFKSIQNRKTISQITKEGLEKVYEELGVIITDNFSDKIKFSKNVHSKESYERIMIFFVILFQRFEII